ncbi:MAG: hypothetical protein EBV27_04395 [Actinobacteria bacterium]|nr:hypothetical protein [Actinomycetota bacterium]
MHIAKIFCVTRDEYDLIEDFITYHSRIFGYDNIVIIDNMSTNKTVLDVYAKYEPLGVKVHYEESYRGDDQGKAFTKYMHMYKTDCKFLIGLDTDEFIYSTKSGDPMSVIKVLEEIDEKDTMLIVEEYPWSIPNPDQDDYVDYKHTRPAKSVTKFNSLKKLTKKVFYRSEAFESTTNGNHDGKVNFGNHKYVNIGYLHFHNTGVRRMLERAKVCIDGYKYVDTTLPNVTQFINMYVSAPWQIGYGYHKQQLYMFFLMKFIVCEYYINNANRVPSKDEIRSFIDKYFLPRDVALLTTFFAELNFLSKTNPSTGSRPTQEDVNSVVFLETNYDPSLLPPYTHDLHAIPNVFVKSLVRDFL